MNILILILILIPHLEKSFSRCRVSLRWAADDAMIIMVMTNKMLPRSGNLLVDHDEFVEYIVDDDDMDDYDEVSTILGSGSSTERVLTPSMVMTTMMITILTS